MKTLVRIALVVCLIVTPLAAQEQQKPMSAEEKAMMEAWQKAMTPGDAHKNLDAFVGTWNTTVKSWMAPGAPPMESSGTSENRWVLGNRYVEQRFKGSFMNMPFEGIGYTGYDNVKKQYFGTWMDNMSTGMMVSTGKAADAKTYTFTGTMADPMTGKDSVMDEKITVVSPDQHVMEMFGPGPDGKTFKMMEITYTRKK